MNKAFLVTLILFSSMSSSTAHASEKWWVNLWKTPDQRGEQLLHQGHAASAAQTYTDPRRRAYAQLKAGDYTHAAKGFAAFDDSDAHYNRGNALARSGNLREALNAYDTALARDSRHKDARQNRELVEKALQQQQAQESSSSKNASSQHSSHHESAAQSQQDSASDSMSKNDKKNGNANSANKPQQTPPPDTTTGTSNSQQTNNSPNPKNSPNASQTTSPQNQASVNNQLSEDKNTAAAQATHSTRT